MPKIYMTASYQQAVKMFNSNNRVLKIPMSYPLPLFYIVVRLCMQTQAISGLVLFFCIQLANPFHEISIRGFDQQMIGPKCQVANYEYIVSMYGKIIVNRVC